MKYQNNGVLCDIPELWLNAEWILRQATRFKLTPLAVSVFRRWSACAGLFLQAQSRVFRHNKRCIRRVSFGAALPPRGPLTLRTLPY